VSAQEASLLSDYVADEPGNILWQAAAVKHLNHNPTSYHLLDDNYPQDRLPTVRDWCDEWPVQRAVGDKNLEPCFGTRIHSGGERMFAATVLNGKAE
jgi:hypothetical protein